MLETQLLSRTSKLFLVVLILAMPALAAAQDGAGTVTVRRGQTRVITVPNIKRVAVGDGNLVEVKAFRDTNQVLLVGDKVGVTDMRTWDFNGHQSRYQVRVVAGGPNVSAKDLREMLHGIRGVSVTALDSGDLLINGTATRSADYALIQSLANRYPSIINQVTKPTVDYKATIRVNARVLEVQRSTMKNLGIDWNDALNGPSFGLLSDFVTNPIARIEGTTATSSSTAIETFAQDLPLNAGTHSYLGINTRLDSVINIMSTSNVARILAEPRVSVVSGQKAHFLVGGEIPTPTTNSNGSTNVEYRQYGIILNIRPVADREGFIDTKVGVEVSSLDDSVTVQGIPGLRTRRTETEMNARDGQTLVISGLLNSEDSKAVSKVPGLGDIPILGELFKSRQFQRQETELVVLVTPELTDASTPDNKKAIQKERELEKSSLEDTKFHIFD